ncbi:MAG: hypothetical protein ACM3PB_00155 [Betaproteobacteria bacterium]
MSQPRESINTDVIGRVMSLEQRTKGIQGRLSALEARLSGIASDDGAGDPGISRDVEFVPAPGLSVMYQMQSTHEARPSALELSLNQPAMRENHKFPMNQAFNVTGLIAGAIMIGASLLLFTGNIEIIKNPLAAMGCGILLIGTALKRIVL